MKGKKFVLGGACLALVIGIMVMANLCYSDSPIIESGNGSVKMANGSLLTMMYETGKGTGEYVVATDTSWPTTGYVFNSTMSKCCS